MSVVFDAGNLPTSAFAHFTFSLSDLDSITDTKMPSSNMEDYKQYLAQKLLTEDQVVRNTSNIPLSTISLGTNLFTRSLIVCLAEL